MSYRINRAGAQEVANKLLDKRDKQVKQLRQDYLLMLTEEAERQVPDNIMKFFKDNHNWMSSQTSCYMNGHGFNGESFSMIRDVPKQHGHEMIKLTKDFADKLKKAIHAHEKERDEVKALRESIVVALCNLRTFKNIQEHLPEAVPFLPKSDNTELIVNFSDIRKKIKAA